MRKLVPLFLFIGITAFAQPAAILHEEDRDLYDKYFDIAAKEFSVPADILRGISFAETRWTQMKWADGDTASSCTGMPRVYGVMGLWDNSYFGYSLRDAAALINKPIDELKNNALQNIRGAAALLKKYYDELPKPAGVPETELPSWQNAIARFSGFPQKEISQERGLEALSIIAKGYHADNINITARPIDIRPIQKLVRQYTMEEQKLQLKNESLQNPNDKPDYPLAKWNPAYSGNFGTQLIQQKFVVIHDVEGSYLGCISWFKNSAAEVSAHFVLNSNPYGVNSSTHAPNGTPDAPVGEVTQMVETKYTAWHVRCWNPYMVGIEHEGYAGVSGWYTPECYASSAKLVSFLCEKYNIPKDRYHVIAHGEGGNSTWVNWVNSTGQGFLATCNDHTDPGPYWNWTTYMNLVTAADTVKPFVVSAFPEANANTVATYKDLKITFNTAMDINSTNAAFSITPATSGTKVWDAGNTELTFVPSAFLQWNTQYTIKIDTTAKNISLKRSLGATPYLLTFRTVPLDTVGPDVVIVYPKNNDTNVPLRADVVITMNEPVVTSSLSTTLKFTDQNNASVALSYARNEVIGDRGVISFSPTLKPNQTYTLKLLPGMKDYYSNTAKTEHIYQFTTTNEIVTAGTPLDQFENNTKGWKQPMLSAGTVNIDSANSSFGIVTEKKYNGTSSGKLTYAFKDSANGVIAVQPTGMPPLDNYLQWGMWVAGDASGNTLQIRFQPDSQVIDLGKITWRGWKYFGGSLSSISGQYKKVDGILVQQASDGAQNGFLYFDDIQLNASINAVQSNVAEIPQAFSLEQNYPNPFNPATVIAYQIPVSGVVHVRVYDLLGREIETLVNEFQTAGNYKIVFDASSLANGIYFYKFTAGTFTDTKKMVLVK